MTTDDDRRCDIRVVVMEADETAREGLVSVLGAQPGIHVVGDAATLADAGGLVARLAPDVVVLDASVSDGSVLDFCRHLSRRAPATRCIVHAATLRAPQVQGARSAGAAATALKSLAGTALVTAIRSVTAGCGTTEAD